MRASAASTSASVVARGVKTRPGAVRKSSPWKVVSRENRAVADWDAHFRREAERYRDGEARLPDTGDADARQRQLTRMGNAAAGAGLSLAHAGQYRRSARVVRPRVRALPRELGRRAARAAGAGRSAILKARILAGDWDGAERDARWTLEQGADDAPTPIGRYAAALAHAVLRRVGRAAHRTPTRCAQDETFPGDVADALAAVASPDPIAYVEAVESVLESFETRDEYLEDLPAADTVLVLQALAERRGIAPAELESPLLPSASRTEAARARRRGRARRGRRAAPGGARARSSARGNEVEERALVDVSRCGTAVGEADVDTRDVLARRADHGFSLGPARTVPRHRPADRRRATPRSRSASPTKHARVGKRPRIDVDVDADAVRRAARHRDAHAVAACGST